MTNETKRREMDVMAAEYALRLLEGEELASANARLRDEPEFVLAVSEWTARLSTLAEDVEEIDPNPAVKQALLDKLFESATPAPFWGRLSFWKGLSIASLALAAGLAIFALSSKDIQPGPLYTAEIVSNADDFRVVAVVDKTSNQVLLTRTAGAAPDGRILQVWAHGPDEPASSVGLWPDGDTIQLALPAVIAAVHGTLTLGVSEEPPGGSTTGSPSGRVFGTVDIPGVRAQN